MRPSSDSQRVLTAEQRKPIGHATGDVHGAAAWLRYCAELATPREVIQDNDAAAEVLPPGVLNVASGGDDLGR